MLRLPYQVARWMLLEDNMPHTSYVPRCGLAEILSACITLVSAHKNASLL